MSRAFVKEDVDPPERRRRARAASGLPPGATNYMTSRGANALRARLPLLSKAERATVEAILASATIIEARADRDHIAFGAKVTVRDEAGALHSYQIVGVDELDLWPGAVSWHGAEGKALLAAELGQRGTLPSGERVEVIAVDYPE